MISAVLFDLDETLLDRTASLTAFLIFALRALALNSGRFNSITGVTVF